MIDLVLRAEKTIQWHEHNLTGNRPLVTLVHELLQEVKTLRAENHFLKTGGTIPGVVTRDAMVDED
jgi:hypothetical protein